MKDIRKIEVPENFERVETGSVQFGEDWPGLFIRGDNYYALLFELNMLLKDTSPLQYPMAHSILNLKDDVIV